jgi:hypothetical protein
LGISWSQLWRQNRIWRFMRIFEDVEIAATVCLNARCAELVSRSGKRVAANAVMKSPAIRTLRIS